MSIDKLPKGVIPFTRECVKVGDEVIEVSGDTIDDEFYGRFYDYYTVDQVNRLELKIRDGDKIVEVRMGRSSCRWFIDRRPRYARFISKLFG